MEIRKVNANNSGDCTFCTRRTTAMMDGKQPLYKVVFEFTREISGGMSVRICRECANELFDYITSH